MPRDSIFYKLVTNEDAYTQLLFNLMVRFDDFRKRVLGLFLNENQALRIAQNEIRTQTVLLECGRPDIVIRTAEICALLEVKVNLGRGLTANQDVTASDDGDVKGYVRFLLDAHAPERWLVFLVPKDWTHRSKVQSSLELLKKTHPSIAPKIVTWEQVLDVVRAMGQPRDLLVEEFRKLLSDRFGYVMFSTEEAGMLTNDFATAYRTVRKLEALVDETRAQAGNYRSEKTSPRERDEYGVYFYNADGKCVLWFGIWLDFCERKGFPLCFGIRDDWKQSVPELEKSFAASCNDTPIPFDGWTVIGIHPQTLDDKPAEAIWGRLKPVLESVAGVGVN